MSTKTCKRCGWVYPITQPGTKCLVCGEPFETVTCCKCDEQFEATGGTTVCPTCRRKYCTTQHAKYKDAMRDRFNQWLEKVKRVPKHYPPLTEEQWLEACRFFDGCARCESDEIDTRGFFVGRELGGRYCDWNVIPLCTRCAKMWQLDKSMFLYAFHKDSMRNDKRYRKLGVSNRPREFQDSLEKLVSYLEVRLDNAIRISADITESAEGSEQDNAKCSGN